MGSWSKVIIHGRTVSKIIEGPVSSIISIYLCTSSSRSKSPNAFPNARLEMTSNVKYEALRPKSIGLYFAAVEMYFDSINLINAATFSSILRSRSSFSFPAYCLSSVRIHLGERQRTPAAILALTIPWLVLSLCDSILSRLGSNLKPRYQMERE